MDSNLRSLQAAAATDEASILLELLQGTSGQAYADMSNGWDLVTPVCDWVGVSCDTSGKVEAVDVDNKGLMGTLPSSLGNLSSLVNLYLGSNQFEGSIPSEITSMSNLKVLDLRFNKLTGLIPFPLTKSIERLHLGHNALTGNLPTGFAQGLVNVQIFDVKYNKLSGPLPIPDRLPAMKSLDLSNNKFQGTIPTEYGDLTSLQNLYLSNNLLSGTIPREIGKANMSLQEIFLHGNLLSGTLPDSLSDLRSLEILFVDDNRLTGTVPEELCAMSLNEVFFKSAGDRENIDVTYEDLNGQARQLHRMLAGDPTSERDGCNSIACPAGYASKGDNNKDGVFPCVECTEKSLNPYIGSNHCLELTQENIISSLYDATNGPAWTGAKNWGDSSVATCEKEGITCNDNKQVTKIVLHDQGLSGSLPSGLGFLSRLVELDVSHNKIGGYIPADLRFAPLITLDVAENQFTGFVPNGLCQKDNVNGNGSDGLYTCDVIACGAGFHSSTGRAGPGTDGERCQLCAEGTPSVLGIIDCTDASGVRKTLTPFGYLGETAIMLFGLTMIAVILFVWRRSRISAEYIANRAYYTHGPGHDQVIITQQENNTHSTSGEDETDPLAGIDGIDIQDRGIANIQVKVKDEWNGGKEKSQKEVWLDVPKIS